MSRQIRVKYAGVIFAAILFVLLIGVVEMHNSDRFASMLSQDMPAPEPVLVENSSDIPEAPSCESIESELVAKLESSRSCRVDADCVLSRFECPFECVGSVSASALDELRREEISFQQACQRCESSCPQELTKWRAACVRQRCIVLDRSIDELEEATLERINE